MTDETRSNQDHYPDAVSVGLGRTPTGALHMLYEALQQRLDAAYHKADDGQKDIADADLLLQVACGPGYYERLTDDPSDKRGKWAPKPQHRYRAAVIAAEKLKRASLSLKASSREAQELAELITAAAEQARLQTSERSWIPNSPDEEL